MLQSPSKLSLRMQASIPGSRGFRWKISYAATRSFKSVSATRACVHVAAAVKGTMQCDCLLLLGNLFSISSSPVGRVCIVDGSSCMRYVRWSIRSSRSTQSQLSSWHASRRNRSCRRKFGNSYVATESRSRTILASDEKCCPAWSAAAKPETT